jgi:hypothetical protein
VKKTQCAQLSSVVLLLISFLPGCWHHYRSSGEVIDSKFRTREEKVAPLFRHGEGSTDHCGCTIGASCWYVYCNELGAIDVIIEELEKAGITIDRRNVQIEGPRNFRRQKFLMKLYEQLTGYDRWILDGYCSEYNIGFEFISRSDCSDLGHEYRGWKWRRYNMIAAAEDFREFIAQENTMTIGVFYDPLFPVPLRSHGSYRELYRNYALINGYVSWLLRCQVRDFISWLRNEGYLEPAN